MRLRSDGRAWVIDPRSLCFVIRAAAFLACLELPSMAMSSSFRGRVLEPVKGLSTHILIPPLMPLSLIPVRSDHNRTDLLRTVLISFASLSMVLWVFFS